MDFWNRKKVRRLERTIDEYKRDIEKLESRLKGDRVCGGYCKKCAHGIQAENFFMGAVYNTIACELDCKCKDFQRKGAES